MDARRTLYLRWFAGVGAALVWVLTAAYVVEREDILRADLDPRMPFQVYNPPPAPDYNQPAAWALRGDAASATSPADVFFVHSTTYDGGRDWSGPITDPVSRRRLEREDLPNFAGPFARLGRVYAPRYRQASLYAYRLTLRDDAREARQFAYGDVAQAFHVFLGRDSWQGPIILVGVGQGAQLVERLARESVAEPALHSRIAAVYLIEETTPEAAFPANGPLPLCERRDEARCVVAWRSLTSGGPDRDRILGRALSWTANGELDNMGEVKIACVNPVTGAKDDGAADGAENLGAANATGMRWDVKPKLYPHQVEARCDNGFLRVTTPERPDLRPVGDWADRLRSPAYNVFYADIEADARARLQAWYGGPLAAPIDRSEPVQPAPVHRVPAGG